MRGASTPQARGELQEIGGDDVEGLRIGHRIVGRVVVLGGPAHVPANLIAVGRLWVKGCVKTNF